MVLAQYPGADEERRKRGVWRDTNMLALQPSFYFFGEMISSARRSIFVCSEGVNVISMLEKGRWKVEWYTCSHHYFVVTVSELQLECPWSVSVS